MTKDENMVYIVRFIHFVISAQFVKKINKFTNPPPKFLQTPKKNPYLITNPKQSNTSRMYY